VTAAAAAVTAAAAAAAVTAPSVMRHPVCHAAGGDGPPVRCGSATSLTEGLGSA
jgi:hypothetical protein